MPRKRCLLCGRVLPAEEYEEHLERHRQVGTVMVVVEEGRALPVFVESIEGVEYLAGRQFEEADRQRLLDLAAQAVGEDAQDGRYEATEELCEWVYLLWPELRPG